MSKRSTKRCETYKEAQEWLAKWETYWPLDQWEVRVVIDGRGVKRGMAASVVHKQDTAVSTIYLRPNTENLGAVILHEYFHIVLELFRGDEIGEEFIVMGVEEMYRKLERKIMMKQRRIDAAQTLLSVLE
jgi:hypothetical protein